MGVNAVVLMQGQPGRGLEWMFGPSYSNPHRCLLPENVSSNPDAAGVQERPRTAVFTTTLPRPPNTPYLLTPLSGGACNHERTKDTSRILKTPQTPNPSHHTPHPSPLTPHTSHPTPLSLHTSRPPSRTKTPSGGACNHECVKDNGSPASPSLSNPSGRPFLRPWWRPFGQSRSNVEAFWSNVTQMESNITEHLRSNLTRLRSNIPQPPSNTPVNPSCLKNGASPCAALLCAPIARCVIKPDCSASCQPRNPAIFGINPNATGSSLSGNATTKSVPAVMKQSGAPQLPMGMPLAGPQPPCQPGAIRAAGICFECRPGTYADPQAQACIGCAPGTYSDARGAPACKPCAPGAHAPVMGAWGCTPCMPGMTSGAGAARCQLAG